LTTQIGFVITDVTIPLSNKNELTARKDEEETTPKQ